ncbi:MAG: hypothetical protein COT74_00795 [Bdellovibrionales bacterium CG10_big_fil_rev_8_21_14_0_10_45_34]|nr:MAG: hypothetical protein COT74_00795 [Bdellovibrionales bacterium CG10_big_fil_rev_8_21_14_0_10_45_34]
MPNEPGSHYRRPGSGRLSFDYDGPHDRDSREAYDYGKYRQQILRRRDEEEFAYWNRRMRVLGSRGLLP